jgi:hypothetical protein
VTVEREEKFRLRPFARKPQADKPPPLASFFHTFLRAVSSGATTRRGSITKPTPLHLQRVAIRVTYVKSRRAGHFRAHGIYLMRDRARGGELAFGSQQLTGPANLLQHWQESGDPRLYKIIVSPEQPVNLTLLVTQLLDRMSDHLNQPLEWIAVNHYNTDYPHAHIALRSRDRNGDQVWLPRTFIKESIRELANQLATEQLGYRTPEQIRRSKENEVSQPRVTSLDRLLVQRSESSGGLSFLAIGFVQGLAVQALGVARPVGKLMQRRAVIGGRRRKRAFAREVDRVFGARIERSVLLVVE